MNVVFQIYIVTHLGYIVWVTCFVVVVFFKCLCFFTKQILMGLEKMKKIFQIQMNVGFQIYIVTHLGYIVWVTCCFLICLGFFTKQILMGFRENEKKI